MRKWLKISVCFILILVLSGCNKTIVIDTSKKNSDVTIDNTKNNDSSNPFDNFYSFYCKINGEEIHLPMTLDELIANGWQGDIDANKKVGSSSGAYNIKLKKGNAVFEANFINSEDKLKRLGDVNLSFVYFDLLSNPDIEVVLPKNITFGKVNTKTLLDTYGEPNDKMAQDNDNQTSWVYEYDTGESIYFLINNKTNLVEGIIMNRFLKEDNFIQTPKVISEYQFVDTLEDSLSSQVFSIENKIYKMPVPVRQFLDNGWQLEVVDPNNDKTLKSGEAVDCSLIMGDKKILGRIKNFSLEPSSFENSYMIYVGFCEVDETVTISPNLTFNTSKEELIELISDIDYVVSGVDLYEVFSIYFSDFAYIDVYVNSAKDKVELIYLYNYPE